MENNGEDEEATREPDHGSRPCKPQTLHPHLCFSIGVQGMLAKYDEEEADAGLQIAGGGVVADARARQQADIRRKLAAGAAPMHWPLIL